MPLSLAVIANTQAAQSAWDAMQVRMHGGPETATLIYLPGLHGDWTLVSSFRRALGSQVRFVEFTYPRTINWTVKQHASAILDCLRERRIARGWLLLESFGSVIGWDILRRAEPGFASEGVILAGGFVRYPHISLVRFARAVNRSVPMAGLKLLCWVYARYAGFRHRRAPETLADVSEFVRRRTQEEDRQAICWRYQLIAGSDARVVAREARVPVYQLCGFVDPVVPWIPVRGWLKRHCSNYKGWRLLWGDHNVLGTAPQKSAQQVLRWMTADAA